MKIQYYTDVLTAIYQGVAFIVSCYSLSTIDCLYTGYSSLVARCWIPAVNPAVQVSEIAAPYGLAMTYDLLPITYYLLPDT